MQLTRAASALTFAIRDDIRSPLRWPNAREGGSRSLGEAGERFWERFLPKPEHT